MTGDTFTKEHSNDVNLIRPLLVAMIFVAGAGLIWFYVNIKEVIYG